MWGLGAGGWGLGLEAGGCWGCGAPPHHPIAPPTAKLLLRRPCTWSSAEVGLQLPQRSCQRGHVSASSRDIHTFWDQNERDGMHLHSSCLRLASAFLLPPSFVGWGASTSPGPADHLHKKAPPSACNKTVAQKRLQGGWHRLRGVGCPSGVWRSELRPMPTRRDNATHQLMTQIALAAPPVPLPPCRSHRAA